MTLFRTRVLVSICALLSLTCVLLAQTEGTARQNLPSGPFQIVPSAYPTSCAENRWGATQGTSVDTVACVAGQSSQLWTLVPVASAGTTGYEIVSANSGFCMDVIGASTGDGAFLDQWPCANQANQVWQLYPFGSSFEIVSVNTGKCLNLTAGSATAGVPLQQHTCSQGTNPSELWNLNLPGSEGIPQQTFSTGPYQILPSTNLSACAENRGSGNRGSAVDATSCITGQTSQLWTLSPSQSGGVSGYEIVSTNSGLCMDVIGGSTADGAFLDQWPCANQPNQVWQLYPFGSSFEIVSINGGKCLSLTGGNTAGIPLQQHTCGQGTNSNELWALPASTAALQGGTGSLLSTSARLQATPTSAITGQAVSMTAQITSNVGTPTGKVSFYDSSVLLGSSTLSNGTASYTAPALANGPHQVTAQYLGTTLYTMSTSQSVQITVAEPTVGEQALQADAFVNSVGVQTHLNYTDTPYFSQWPAVFAELQASGIRHLRDGYGNWPSNSPFVTEHNALAATGIKTTYIIPLDWSISQQNIQDFAPKVQDLEALEPPNECDAVPNCGGGNQVGVANVIPFLPVVTNAAQVLGVPILGPAFVTSQAYQWAGNLSSYMTYNNLHVYFGGRYPGSNGWGGGDAQGNFYGSFNWWIDTGNIDAPNVPDVITETGYLSYPTTNIPYTIPESIEASYVPRLLLQAFNHGIKRSYLYELLDEVPSTGYGLLNYDLSEKPVFTAIRHFLPLLSDSGTAFSPGALSYSINGGDATINHTLLQKRDGSFWLIVWLEQSSYNIYTNTFTPVVPQSVTLSLNGIAVAKQIIQFDSSGNTQTTTISSPTSSLPIVLTDQLTVIHIAPQ